MSDHTPTVLRVKDVVRETADAATLVFDGPPLPYAPGQFLTLRIPSDLKPTARCYSLSSSPHVDQHLAVTVKKVAGGYGSAWVVDEVVPGTAIDVLPPSGHFTPKDLDSDLLLFAGGSGITPVMSILRSVLAAGTGRLTLVYANRDDRSVIFAAALADLVRAHPDRLLVHHWLESVSGLPTVATLAALAAPYADRQVFVCGPAPFMAAVEEAVATVGVARQDVHVERFVSLEGDPWAAPAPVVAGDGPAVTATVLLDGAEHEVVWPEGARLLDTLLDAGLDAPYSCREGNCSACGCKVLAGSVTMVANQVLEQQDLDEGWVLACQAQHTGGDVRVSYDD